ncbi:hypothetical protein LXM94_03470, partial [Rhizobium sp. TRM95111]|nr:hypothetical protein [Rhizobium alarense]
MSEIRGEKVVFRRRDIVCMHELPSAQAYEPIVLHATDGPGFFGVCWRIAAGCVALAVMLGLLVFAVIEGGLADASLNSRAIEALNRAVGPDYTVSVERTVLRFSQYGKLTLRAENVSFVTAAGGRSLASTSAVAIALDPLALIGGRVVASSIAVNTVAVDPSLLPKRQPVDLTALRVGSVPAHLEGLFKALDDVDAMVSRSGLETVTIADLAFPLAARSGATVPLVVESLTFTRDADDGIAIDGRVSIAGETATLAARAARSGRAIAGLDASIEGVALGALLMEYAPGGERHSGPDLVARAEVKGERAIQGARPALAVTVEASDGLYYFGGDATRIGPSRVALYYDFDREAVEIAPSVIKAGQSAFPLTGAIVDLDRMPGAGEPGYAIDLLVRDAESAPIDTAEKSVRFDLKA